MIFAKCMLWNSDAGEIPNVLIKKKVSSGDLGSS